MRHLGPAERDVLEKFAVGMTYAEIARVRGSAPGTIRSQISSIRSVLHIGSRPELVAWAWVSGWMTFTPDWALRRVR